MITEKNTDNDLMITEKKTDNDLMRTEKNTDNDQMITEKYISMMPEAATAIDPSCKICL